MNTWTPRARRYRGAIGGGIATGLALLLAATASAASPNLDVTATDAVVGGTIHATAQLSESPGAIGEISFEVFGPGDPTCSGPALTPAPASAAVSGEGGYASGDFTSPAAGTYRWSAHYSGDLENPPADSNCAAISTVDRATPTLAGEATTAVTAGSAITDEATLAGGFSVAGQLVFRAFGPGDTTCAAGPKYEATVAVSGPGSYSPAGFSPGAGSYRWTAEYPGDGNNEAVSTVCGAANQSSTVGKASPSVSGLATSAATVGSAITDGATLSGGSAPGGQLVFRAYGPSDPSCAAAPKYEAPVAVSGPGFYAPAGFSPGPGTYLWTVEYEGDQDNDAASTACGAASQSSLVSKATPTLSGVATTAVTVGSAITDGATLGGGFTATGQLVFRAFGPGDTTCAAPPKYEATVAVSGAGAYSPSGFSPGPGTYQWTVEYEGDGNNAAVSTTCGVANQSSAVTKASPGLEGIATSAATVGSAITDNATFSGGFVPAGQLVFRAYGPGDSSCASAPKYEATVGVSGPGSYAPPGFSPGPGLYRWTVGYPGDGNNEAVSTACDAANQSSAVGVVAPTLTAGATGATVGDPVTATASLQEGAIPRGQITFKAFSPADASCAGTAAFSSTVGVAGNGSYRSAPFSPSRVGSFRWVVSYSGDANHAPIATPCGSSRSDIAQARPSITGLVSSVLTVGTSFRDTATLSGGHSPSGTVTFKIYGPVAGGCAKPAFVDTVAVKGNGTVESDPFVAKRPGRYSFVASYSGDATNQGTSQACDSAGQVALVQKRALKVRPRARMGEGKQILIRANLSGAAAPSGVINFHLYGPGNSRCKGKPAFSGGISIKSNGTYSLATYLATKSGVYRLVVGYSGDQRNKRSKAACGGAQSIRVG